MRPISIRELRWLLGRHTPPCVSIYVPSERRLEVGGGRETFQALVAEASRLLAEGLSASEAAALLAPVQDLIGAPFWARRIDALAVFRSRDLFTHYRIPATVPELAVVADTFHTRPLVRYLNSSRRHFYVLALGAQSVELLEGTPDRLTPLAREDLPPELCDALDDERGVAYLSTSTAAASVTPDATPVAKPNGSGARDDRLRRYFRSIDRALWDWLKDDLAPVILAGRPEHHAAYQAASRYPELLDEGIEQDVASTDRAELHLRAIAIIRAHEADVLGAVLARLSSALSTGHGDADLAAIARAAVQGRVRLLVFAEDAQQWGRLDRTTGELHLSDRQRDEVDADVIDDLCEVVLLAGGDVHEIPAGALPGPVAAIYR